MGIFIRVQVSELIMLLGVVGLVLGVLYSTVEAVPPPPEDAVPCPYPAPEDIYPCECLADPRTLQIYVICYWTMGDDYNANIQQFNDVLNNFDTFEDIYVMEMTCDESYNFILDGFFNETTTGRFHINYFTLEHFEPSDIIPSDDQFSPTAFIGSQDTLEYLKIDANHYFTPSTNMLAGMKNLVELQLHGLDSQMQILPSLSSLSTLRLLSLSEGAFPTLTAQNFAGLNQLGNLFLDNSQVTTIQPDTFKGLPSLNRISLTYNLLENLVPNTFSDLPNLAFLNLGNNLLEEISEDFSGLSANTQILLHNNKIKILAESTFRNFAERVINTPLAEGLIDLDNNPLECGCDVKWAVVDTESVAVFRNARCKDGTKLEDVDPEYLNFFCP